MDFEYDDKKSSSNVIKHGIDFESAKSIWDDENRVEIPVQDKGETRYLMIGIINKKHWSAIITYRNNNIRLISVRRSRIEEVTIYENF